MTESKYLLNHEFKILYCPSINIKLSTKELDMDTLKFVKYNGNLDTIDYFFEIDTNTVNDILGTVLNCKFGYELSTAEMDWIQKFENELKTNKEISKNRVLISNFYILKMRLAGFGVEFATAFAINYFRALSMQDVADNLTSVEQSIKKLDDIISSKEVWIGNEIDDYTSLDETFLSDVLKRKIDNSLKFEEIKGDYLKLIQKSFIIYIYRYNSIKSYLVKETINILDNKSCKEILLDIHERIISGILKYLIENDDYPNFANDKFIYNLINELSDTVSLYLTMVEDSLRE